LNVQRILVVLSATLTLTLLSGAAWASRVAGDVISGPVTAATRESVTINGREYHVRVGSPAAATVSHITPGQQVEVHLDGPVNASRSEVINVIVRRAQ
jgi:hypothetical protein